MIQSIELFYLPIRIRYKHTYIYNLFRHEKQKLQNQLKFNSTVRQFPPRRVIELHTNYTHTRIIMPIQKKNKQ